MTEKRAPGLDLEVAQILNAPFSRNKLFRHHTDVSSRPASRRKHVEGYDNVIFEDEDEAPERANTPHQKAKPGNIVSRHQTEVLNRRKDLMDDRIPVITIEAPPVTRRKVSRCGSRVEFGVGKSTAEDGKIFTNKAFLKSTTHALDSRNNKVKSRIDETQRRISAHRDSKAIYPHIQRAAFDRIAETLQEHNIVVVSGPSGEGKTYTALELLDHVTAEDSELRPVVVYHPVEFEEFMALPATRYVFLVDDFLGKHDIDVAVYTEWTRLSALVQKHVTSKRIYVIITVRDTILQKLSTLTHIPVLSRVNNTLANVVDLKEMQLTGPDKLTLVTGYARLHALGLDAGQLQSVADTVYTEYGFPLLCRLMNLGPRLEIFTKPFQVIYDEIESYRTGNVTCYIVLLLTMALEGRYPVDGFSKSQLKLFEGITSKLQITDIGSDTLTTVVVKLKDLGALTYRRDLQCHGFTHDLIFIALLSNLYTHHADLLFEFCPVYIISELFDTHNDVTNDVHLTSERGKFVVTTKQFNPILARFKAVIESTSSQYFQSVSTAKLWDVDAFIELAVAMFGIDFFFKPDDNGNSLTVHFASIGKEKVTRKLTNFIDEFHDKGEALYQEQFRKAVIYACKYSHLDVVRHLLKLVDKITLDEMFAAAEGGNVEIAKLLVSKGGSFFERREEDKCNMFHWACRFARTGLVHYIIEHLQTDHDLELVRRRDKFGRTACHFAAIGGDVDIMKYLVAHDFDPITKAKDNTTVLHDASAFGMLEMVQFLCTEYAVLLRAADTAGFTAAHHAAREGHADILKYVLDMGIDHRAQLTDGNGIMHLAGYNNRLMVIKYLLEHYPDLQHMQNNITFIPVQVATQGGKVEVVDYFIVHGTNPYLLTVDMRTLLHLAAFNGRLELVKHLCTHYADMVQSRDSEGNTVAHDGAASGHVEVVAYLLQKHIDPVAVSGDKCTLLHDACFYGKIDMAKYLVEVYPQLLDMESSNGFTACHAAALGGYVDILVHLVRNHADPMAVSHDGGNLLHEAAFNGQLQMVRHLSKTYPDMVHARNHKSYTPSHFAAQEGHLDILSFLLQETEDTLLLTEENQTHLHIASYNGRLDITQYLCREYPDMVVAADNGGAVAIHYASRGGSMHVLSYLLEHTFDQTVKTDSGSTILHLAAYDGNMDIVKLLCEQYPSLIHIADLSGHNACHYAAGSGHVDLLKFILSHNVDHKVTTENGSTVLLKAAYNGKLDMVMYLSAQYPDLLTVADNFGCNALHYTACEGYTDVLKYLVEQDLDPMSRTNEQHTILHIAAYHGKLAMVEYICETFPELIVTLDSNGQTAEQFAKLGGHADVEQFFMLLQASSQDNSTDGGDSKWYHTVALRLRRLVSRCRNCRRQDVTIMFRACGRCLLRPVYICRRR